MAHIRRKIRKFILHKVLHADDTPHALALGAGIAVFVAFLPLVGIQTIVSIGIAALLRANKAICVPIVWITNPATIFPIYYGCLRVGQFMLPTQNETRAAKLGELVELGRTGSIFEAEFWSALARLLWGLGLELWLGCAIVGTVFGVAAYWIVRWVVTSYRERRRQRLLRRNLFRARYAKATVSTPPPSP